MAAVIVRVAPRHGRAAEHHRIDADTARIGRAFDNDVIVPDPFVGAAQFRLRREGERLLLEVLDRTNPVLVNARRCEESLIELASGDEIGIGHSVLTVLREDTPVAPTRRIPSSLWGRLGAGRPLVAALALLAVGATSILLDWLSTVDAPQWHELIASALVLGAILLGWATAWALIARTNRHHAQFAGHLALACLVVLAGFAISAVVEYAAYASDTAQAVNLGDWLSGALLLFLLCYGEFRMATHLRRPALAGLLAALLPLGLLAAFQWASREEFNPQPDTATLLRAPFAKLRTGRTLDDYDAELAELFERVRAD